MTENSIHIINTLSAKEILVIRNFYDLFQTIKADDKANYILFYDSIYKVLETLEFDKFDIDSVRNYDFQTLSNYLNDIITRVPILYKVEYSCNLYMGTSTGKTYLTAKEDENDHHWGESFPIGSNYDTGAHDITRANVTLEWDDNKKKFVVRVYWHDAYDHCRWEHGGDAIYRGDESKYTRNNWTTIAKILEIIPDKNLFK